MSVVECVGRERNVNIHIVGHYKPQHTKGHKQLCQVGKGERLPAIYTGSSEPQTPLRIPTDRHAGLSDSPKEPSWYCLPRPTYCMTVVTPTHCTVMVLVGPPTVCTCCPTHCMMPHPLMVPHPLYHAPPTSSWSWSTMGTPLISRMSSPIFRGLAMRLRGNLCMLCVLCMCVCVCVGGGGR